MMKSCRMESISSLMSDAPEPKAIPDETGVDGSQQKAAPGAFVDSDQTRGAAVLAAAVRDGGIVGRGYGSELSTRLVTGIVESLKVELQSARRRCENLADKLEVCQIAREKADRLAAVLQADRSGRQVANAWGAVALTIGGAFLGGAITATDSGERIFYVVVGLALVGGGVWTLTLGDRAKTGEGE
jgi:hypothetical protein